MMRNFRTFDRAVEFYRLTTQLTIQDRHLKDQLSRASLSISLNLAEGRGRSTLKDQKRFFVIAFGSLREVQAILLILGLENSIEWKKLDELAAQLYRLIQNIGKGAV